MICFLRSLLEALKTDKVKLPGLGVLGVDDGDGTPCC